MDNVFIERLWRSLKYEDIYLKGYSDGHEAKAGIARCPHQALENRAPMAVWRAGVTGAFGEEAVDRRFSQARRVAHIPTATTAASKSSVKLLGTTNGSSST
jgi:hypothetical protein